MSQLCIDFKQYQERVSAVVPIRFTGKVVHVAGLVIESNGPSVPVGRFVLYSIKQRACASSCRSGGF